jgi:hypothetical protein
VDHAVKEKKSYFDRWENWENHLLRGALFVLAAMQLIRFVTLEFQDLLAVLWRH